MNKSAVILAAICAVLVALPAHGTVIHVSPSGSDASGGASWAAAKRTLQAAVGASSSGDEVWAAAGTYAGPVTIPSGVSLYGGFAGWETQRDLRLPSANVTRIESGGPAAAVSFPMGATMFTRLDGFTVRATGGDGVSCADGSPVVADCSITSHGSGISCRVGTALIQDCRISDCGGSGVHCSEGAGPGIVRCEIMGSARYGVVCMGGASPLVSHCRITLGGQGGIWCDVSSPTVRNCLISSNAGYGIAAGGECFPEIVNNTVAWNTGTGIALADEAQVVNNIVASNARGISLAAGSRFPSLLCNCVHGNSVSDYSGLAPGTLDVLLPPGVGTDGHLLPNSPCIDAGADSYVLPGWIDLDGQERLQGAHVDIGADEASTTAAAATIPQALLSGDGTLVQGVTGTVSAAWPDVFYVQTGGRSCGVRVAMAAHGRKAGDVVAVDGVIGTGEEGERRIAASSTTLVGSALAEPLCLPLARLGGGDWHYDASSGAGRRGVTGGGGLNNVGLLVRVCGWVASVDAGAGTFTVSELSAAPGGNTVTVIATGLALPQPGKLVSVTGASSCIRTGGETLRCVRVPAQTGISFL